MKNIVIFTNCNGYELIKYLKCNTYFNNDGYYIIYYY